jgi:hypothetical protein
VSKQVEYETDLQRRTSASLFFLSAMVASREVYGKSYFALGAAEKQALDQMVFVSIVGNYHALTPEWFGSQKPAQTGFQPPVSPPQVSPQQ